MSQGIAVRVLPGLMHADRMYAKLKNGAVYVHRMSMNPEQQAQLLSGLKANRNRLVLKHWKRVAEA